MLTKREKKVRRHIYITPSSLKWLEAEGKRFDRSVGDIIDHLVKEARNARTLQP